MGSVFFPWLFFKEITLSLGMCPHALEQWRLSFCFVCVGVCVCVCMCVCVCWYVVSTLISNYRVILSLFRHIKAKIPLQGQSPKTLVGVSWCRQTQGHQSVAAKGCGHRGFLLGNRSSSSYNFVALSASPISKALELLRFHSTLL